MRNRHESGVESRKSLSQKSEQEYETGMAIRSSGVTTSPPREPTALAIDAKASQGSSQES